MKKLLAVLICVILALTVFAACSKQPEEEDHGNVSETMPSVTEVTTDDAVLINSKASDYIKLYTPEELSLSQEDYDNCSYMVGGNGVEIEGDYYVKVAVVNKISHVDEEGNETFTFDIKGEYYIRYDAKRVLKKDLTSEEPKYEDMEVKEIPEEMTATVVATEAATEAASEEDTTE